MPSGIDFVDALGSDAPDFVEALERLLEITSAPGEGFDHKTKLLFTMALDIAMGLAPNAKRVADLARGAGATEAEIVDVLKICFVNAGLQRLSTGCAALPVPPGPEPSYGGTEYRIQAPPFMEAMQPLAEEWVNAVVGLLIASPTPGSGLSESTKRLFSMALDITMGFPDYAKEMARLARSEGATEAEIVDVLKLCFINGGLQRLAVGTQVLSSGSG